jgi:hypothetical protein
VAEAAEAAEAAGVPVGAVLRADSEGEGQGHVDLQSPASFLYFTAALFLHFSSPSVTNHLPSPLPPAGLAGLALRRARQRGSALLLVMWLISMLSLLIYSTIRVISHDMDITISQKKAFRARQLTEMGLNIACNPAVKDTDTALLNQTIAEGESFAVTIRGEGGRFNVNTLLQANDRTHDTFPRQTTGSAPATASQKRIMPR